MTPTEEQRAAIHAVSGLLTAIGCPQCHSYLQKNYTHHIEVLRAMTDSSEHFTDVTKMIGFDLAAARDAVKMCNINITVWAHSCAKHLPGAIDLIELQTAEIERLRADNAGLSKAVISIQEERDLAQAEFRAYHKAWEEQAIEIERLQGFETAARDLNNDLIRIAGERDELAARIQELEDALVEMVATNPCNIPTLCGVVHDELMCLALDGNCDFWKGCPQKNELRKAARKQLQAEGKIGPDARPKCDHAWQAAIEERGYQTCLKCGECRDIKDIPRTAPAWQITAERVGLLEYCLESLLDAPDIDDYSEPRQSIRMLRAMLTEAGQ